MEYLILGAGAAGLAAMENIRKLDPEGKITVCTAEPGPPYSLCGLPDMVAGTVGEEGLETVRGGYFEAHDIDHRPGWEASGLESYARPTGKGHNGKVAFTNGEKLEYEKLLLATGSAPLLPPLAGLDRPGVFTRLDRSGCRLLDREVAGVDRVGVIGGGFLGVEMAQALRARGLTVTLHEMEGRLLASMLDPPRSAAALELVEGLGIQVRLNCRIRSIRGEDEKGQANGLEAASGKTYPCDLVVLAVGVVPNLAWLEGSGVVRGDSGGLRVNGQLRTNLPGVFAAGDLVESWDPHTLEPGLKPTWTNAAQQGRLAGLAMSDPAAELSYTGWDDFNVLHIGEVGLVSCGQVNALPPGTVEVDAPANLQGWLAAPGDQGEATLYLHHDRPVGLCGLGLPPNLGHLHHLIQRGDKIDGVKEARELFFEVSLEARRRVRPAGPQGVPQEARA